MQRHPTVRLLMVLTGVALLMFYAAAAYVSYVGLLFLWQQRPDPVLTVLVVTAVALVFGYSSHQFGTARILHGIGAREIPEQRAPELYRRVDELAGALDIARPRVLVAEMPAPNALALGGPSDGDVVLDASLFRLLTASELEAIIAHELAHLQNRDGLVQTLGYSLVQTVSGLLALALLPLTLLVAGTTRALAYMRGESTSSINRQTAYARALVTSASILLLFVFTLALRAHSRRRELAADDIAVSVTGRPRSLATALQKIERAATPTGPLSSLYIHGDEQGPWTQLLATHPPMGQRIRRLEKQADAQSVRVAIQ